VLLTQFLEFGWSPIIAASGSDDLREKGGIWHLVSEENGKLLRTVAVKMLHFRYN